MEINRSGWQDAFETHDGARSGERDHHGASPPLNAAEAQEHNVETKGKDESETGHK